MTIARRLTLLTLGFVLVALLTGCVVLAVRDYAHARDALELKATQLVATKPEFAAAVRFSIASQLNDIGSEALALSPAVKRVRVFTNLGEEVLAKTTLWATGETAPMFSTLREDRSPLDTVASDRPSDYLPPRLAAFAAVLQEKELTQIMPVVSLVDPLKDGIDLADFAAAAFDPESANSLFVVGYLEITLSRSVILSESLNSAAISAVFSLVLAALFGLVIATTTRRITKPLRDLTVLADDVAAGRQVQTVPVSGIGEVRQISEIVNGMVTGMNRQKKSLDVDRKMLNLQVDRRDEQLSQQQKELAEAKEKVSTTEDRLRHLAYFDLLTGLPNRRLFSEQLGLLLRLAIRNGEQLALLVLDIDHFKRVNDSLGTEAGDRLLKQVALRLEKSVRSSDVPHRTSDKEALMDLSRMGGDEFAVVLNNLPDERGAAVIAARIIKALEQPFRIDDNEVAVAATVGIAIAPRHGKTTEALFRAADTAMINGKKQGRNCLQVYSGDMVISNKERLKLENELRKARERKQLIVHYQPQVDSRNAKLTGAEALVRWSHPDRGLVPPNQWIPIAEELGLIGDIGDWVLERACKDLAELRRIGLDLPKVSVNVSALQLNEGFTRRVRETLDRANLDPGSLQIELTEGLMIGEQEATVQLLRQLKELGVRLSIDDFGTGYSSLSYLTRFPLNELKVDRSFVLGILESEQKAELVKAILAMGQSLGLEIVVEGVERVEEMDFFEQHSVHCIQGFLFSPAVPAKKLHKLLEPGHFENSLHMLRQQLSGTQTGVDMRIEQA
ncbi:MAG: EAL domain-containing protein [Pseudomonadota bacterium]